MQRTVFTDLEDRRHDEDFLPIPASVPTGARPGSTEKIEVMRERVALGQDLWHSADNDEPLPPDTKNKYQPGIREFAMPPERKSISQA